MRPNAHAPDLA